MPAHSRSRSSWFCCWRCFPARPSRRSARPWLGADVADVTKAEAEKLGWDTPHGARVGVLAQGSPADKAGLKAGDVILAIERTIIDTASEVEAALSGRRPGGELRLQVLSGGRERRVAVMLGERMPAGIVARLLRPNLAARPRAHDAREVLGLAAGQLGVRHGGRAGLGPTALAGGPPAGEPGGQRR